MTTSAPHAEGAQDLAVLLGNLFLGRSSSSARLARRADGDKTERYGLVLQQIREHLAGRTRFGAVPFVDSERVGWGCIDYDATLHGLDPDSAEALTIVTNIVEALAAYGIRAALERSKGKGWHVWVFFNQPAPAGAVRALLRGIALDAGAHDEPDLVCPRQDRLTDGGAGNGTWLPLFGGDAGPRTKFHVINPDSMAWIEAPDQAAVIAELVQYPTPTEAIPPAESNGAGSSSGPTPGTGEHSCSWILDELADEGVNLEAVRLGKDKLQFRCPIHAADNPRSHGGSAVFFSSGSGWCASTRCDKRWKTVGEFLALLGPQPSEGPRLRLLTREEFEADVAPAAIVERLLYEASTHNATGASKTGKTWLLLQLLMAIRAGEPFLGLATQCVPVLLLSLELSAGMLRERMRKIHAATGIPYPDVGDGLAVLAGTARCAPSLDLRDDAGLREVERLIRETGARVVAFDTLYRFLPGADPSDNGEMGAIFGRLNDLAQRTGAALLLIDHVGKGEQLGPVSHSALGASVKGGAARAVIGLKRTSRENGGKWSLDVESHFGSWEEPLYYERPRLADGTRGGGCILCSASEAHGLKFETVRQLFETFGGRDEKRRPVFASGRKLREALIEAKHAGGNSTADEMVTAIMRDYCAPEESATRLPDRPILTSTGPRRALIFTWRQPAAGGG